MGNADCIFCRIVRREAPASIVYEDDRIMAFLDIRPVNPGHTLVVPKHHYTYIWELPDDEVGKLFVMARRIVVAAKEALGANGVRIVQLNGRSAGQEVMHLHIHVIPYYAGGTAQRRAATRKELEQIARKICGHLESHLGEP